MSQEQKNRILRTVIKLIIVLVLAFLIAQISKQHDQSQNGGASGTQQEQTGSAQSGSGEQADESNGGETAQDESTAADNNDEQDLTTANNTTLTGEDASEKKETIYTFRNRYLLEQHFEKHGGDFDYATAEEYENGASAVINNPKALHKTEAEDGDDVYFVEKTGEFVVLSTDGYIRTYFRPRNGIKYFNRQ